ncbi:hypothetical protein P154DRAFT_291596 [Amniculicola lignicola CBS 123094]|uniref:Retrotransposon gag domain-containing protein n=1 Tax=Amniculicola lignicola CBS 123094 TaxID=1392246 RepID=A0A6A5WWA5_9PLEO|nr:hypothetical protein P154DRAFT_291596 [Amniculicola lignicola CBS 123094]
MYTDMTPEQTRMAEDIAYVRQIGGNLKFYPEQIGFFHPDMSNTDDGRDTAEIGGKIHYRNVRDFIEAAERAVETRQMPEHVVRSNLHLYLKGLAVSWFQTQLTKEQKREGLQGPGVQQWAKILTKRWRTRPEVALRQLQERTYGPKDVSVGKPPSKWFLTVQRLQTENAYVLHAWNWLDTEVRLALRTPDEGMDASEFMRMMDERMPDLQARFGKNRQKRKQHEGR